MTTLAAHSGHLAFRDLRNLSRQPWYIAITLLQPLLYLFLFGALFERIADLPGFGAESYITFLAPGIVVMSAFFSAGWNGMGVIEDLDRGVIDRLLVSPARRASLILGRLGAMVVVILIQASVLTLLAVVVGARFDGGLTGIAVVFLAAVLLAIPFAALSNAVAIGARQQESLIGATQFVQLPLAFTSSLFMATALMPEWMQAIARVNPVDWAVVAARAGLETAPDWTVIGPRLVALAVFGVVAILVAVRAFGSYQRSI